ncbi:hypothetical protein JCM8097_003630 [Rhodosporidiobolus ruineniae]
MSASTPPSEASTAKEPAQGALDKAAQATSGRNWFGRRARRAATTEEGEGEVDKPKKHLDFGFLPIPKHLRHDPSKPFEFTTFHNWLFAVGATITVSNLYYNQPILVQLASYFDTPYDTVTKATTLVQAGYLCGLVLISPLGDLVPRRPFILTLVTLGGTLAIGLAVCPSSNFTAFLAIHFLTGFVNVTPQVLIPLAADLAHPSKRAASVSIVLSGLILGMVWGRLFAGLLARYTSSPLHVYWLAAAGQYALLITLYWFLPSFPKKKTGLNYFQILWSMVKLFCTEPTLFQACFIGLFSCAIMVSWWTSLTFLLSDTPFSYNTFEIGLFGLTGICAVAWAPFAGKLTDKIMPWCTTLIALCGHVVYLAMAVGTVRLSVAPVIISCILVDICHQTNTVGNQARFFAIDPKSRARVNATYMSFVFVGQAIGSSTGPKVFLRYGWRACYALSLAYAAAAIVILLLRGPHAGGRWIGWGGKYSLRKEKAVEAKKEPEKVVVRGGEEEEVAEVDVEAQKVEGFLASQETTIAEPEAVDLEEMAAGKTAKKHGEVESV